MNGARLTLAPLVALGLAAGCDATQRVEVTGEVTSAQAVAGPISLEFLEQAKDFEDPSRDSVKTVELEGLGPFTEIIEVSEDIVIAVALQDADGDGHCTDGELWAEASEEIAPDGTLPPLELELAAKPCR